MIKIDKIKELNFNELLQLKNEVTLVVQRIRATFDINPTVKFNNFNLLLIALNNEIEKRIENEYLE